MKLEMIHHLFDVVGIRTIPIVLFICLRSIIAPVIPTCLVTSPFSIFVGPYRTQAFELDPIGDRLPLKIIH